MSAYRVVLGAALLVISASGAAAQIYEDVGTRAQGMGGAFVAVADDATATWWNPAGLATGAYFNAITEYGRIEGQPDGTGTGVAVAFPALGLSYYRLRVSQIGQPAASTVTPDVDRQDQRVVSWFGLTTGQSLGAHLVVASTLKVVRSGDTHGDLDLGAMVRAGDARFGLTVKNVTAPSFGTDDPGFALKRQVRVGAQLTKTAGVAHTITVAADADLTASPTQLGETKHVAAGVELWLFQRRLGLRGGVSASTLGETRQAESVGASLAVRPGAYLEGQATVGDDAVKRGWSIDLRVTY